MMREDTRPLTIAALMQAGGALGLYLVASAVRILFEKHNGITPTLAARSQWLALLLLVVPLLWILAMGHFGRTSNEVARKALWWGTPAYLVFLLLWVLRLLALVIDDGWAV